VSIMRCPACERAVDTDFECGEEVKGQWLCDRCAGEQDEAGCGDLDAANVDTSELDKMLGKEDRPLSRNFGKASL
jgi:hypothetical protein